MVTALRPPPRRRVTGEGVEWNLVKLVNSVELVGAVAGTVVRT